MQQISHSPLFDQMTPDEQTAILSRISEYVNTVLPQLVAAGRAISGERVEQFHEGLHLLAHFPQYKIFAIRTLAIRHDYHQHIATMAYQFSLLTRQISDQFTVRTIDGQHVVVVQQTQSLRRGRPTSQESDQRKRDEQAAARAEVVSRITGAAISTTDAAPLAERDSDTSRRKKDSEPDLFSAAVNDQINNPSTDDTPQSSLLTPNSSLRDWLPLLPDNLASSVRTLRDLRAEMAHEAETAKLLFEQGEDPAAMQPHTQRAKEVQNTINALYADIDNYLAWLFVMLTEVNKDWGGLAARYEKATQECFEKLTARLKPYLVKVLGTDKEKADAAFNDLLADCRKKEAARIAAEQRDPEKEKLMHKMDAYIRRKDVKPSPKRLANMRQYRDKLASLGADPDSLAAYDVFIAATEKEIQNQ